MRVNQWLNKNRSKLDKIFDTPNLSDLIAIEMILKPIVERTIQSTRTKQNIISALIIIKNKLLDREVKE